MIPIDIRLRMTIINIWLLIRRLAKVVMHQNIIVPLYCLHISYAISIVCSCLMTQI
jgi:hypothetical protein